MASKAPAVAPYNRQPNATCSLARPEGYLDTEGDHVMLCRAGKTSSSREVKSSQVGAGEKGEHRKHLTHHIYQGYWRPPVAQARYPRTPPPLHRQPVCESQSPRAGLCNVHMWGVAGAASPRWPVWRQSVQSSPVNKPPASGANCQTCLPAPPPRQVHRPRASAKEQRAHLQRAQPSVPHVTQGWCATEWMLTQCAVMGCWGTCST